MPRGRQRNQDRDLSIALGLPTYIGKVHPVCGGAERFIKGGCVRCITAARAATIAKRMLRAEQRAAEALARPGRGCPRNQDRLDSIARGSRYYTGRVHKQCGTARKYVKGGGCVHCAREGKLAAHRAAREAKYALKQQAAEQAANEPIVIRERTGPTPTRFFTGIPCKHGHVCERMVSSGACVLCQTAMKKRRRSTREGRDKRNARLAAKRAQRPPRLCVICATPFPITSPRMSCSDECSEIYYSESRRMRERRRAMAGIPPKGHSKKRRTPMRVLKQQYAERQAEVANQGVDFKALAEARALTKEKRDTSHLLNAEAYRARCRRSHEEASRRIAEALAVAEMMAPDTLKGLTYQQKVAAALDFVKAIGAQHPTTEKTR